MGLDPIPLLMSAKPNAVEDPRVSLVPVAVSVRNRVGCRGPVMIFSSISNPNEENKKAAA
jgi:hypothetical protein